MSVGLGHFLEMYKRRSPGRTVLASGLRLVHAARMTADPSSDMLTLVFCQSEPLTDVHTLSGWPHDRANDRVYSTVPPGWTVLHVSAIQGSIWSGSTA